MTDLQTNGRGTIVSSWVALVTFIAATLECEPMASLPPSATIPLHRLLISLHSELSSLYRPYFVPKLEGFQSPRCTQQPISRNNDPSCRIHHLRYTGSLVRRLLLGFDFQQCQYLPSVLV